MKYQCIKDKWIEDTKIMSYGDIIVVSEDKKQIYNITSKVDIKNVTIDYLLPCLMNISDDLRSSTIIKTDNTDFFEKIMQEMYATYKKKNHDYGNSFNKSLDNFGLVASVIRIGDKMNRFETLTKKEAQVCGESIRDTLLDMANYAIMTVMWMDNQKFGSE